jgi:hypothetical protein
MFNPRKLGIFFFYFSLLNLLQPIASFFFFKKKKKKKLLQPVSRQPLPLWVSVSLTPHLSLLLSTRSKQEHPSDPIANKSTMNSEHYKQVTISLGI